MQSSIWLAIYKKTDNTKYVQIVTDLDNMPYHEKRVSDFNVRNMLNKQLYNI